MQYVWWLIIGLIAGALARLIMPGRDPMGILATIILGVLGSILGGFVSTFIFRSNDQAGFHPGGLIMSLLGAILLLWIWRMIKGRTAAAP